ncbi:N-acetylmuramic acid 6-phosphate etherase [Symmachiella dynata]|uniref:N-acetylmuramic acid 6-phosphate etherase n=1 Tax=Symmachiella dynata TaxID=2527995 RepID=UPI00118A645D|nr:N-acetylmuramic acid 6-phosphate etherase [Symmachiella dynata]QDT49113.1 N-acetylmuramic acid 6-phosphate etherase [Symmachiella dynata]
MTSHSLNLDHMTTERRNSASESLDRMTAEEIVALMNAEDAQVAAAVSAESSAIAQAIDVIADRLAGGGRLIYIGAGTSGRLGVLDASECPPTFNSPPGQVVGVIAGGKVALTSAVEGAEDQPEDAIRDLQAIALSAADVLVGIATSGRTPYVLGGLSYARDVGAYAIGLACNTDSELSRKVQLMIAPVVGPEVITGSSRLKAGTATKMVLNMLSTGAMVRLGKTFGNLMVDLQAKNQKLLERSRRIVAQLTGLSIEEADRHLQRCGGDVKTAIVAHQRQLTPPAARNLLSDVQGHLRNALESPRTED